MRRIGAPCERHLRSWPRTGSATSDRKVFASPYSMLGRESCLDYQRAWVKNHRRDTRYAIRDTRYAIRDTRYAIRNTRYAIRAAKHAGAAAGHAHENVLPLPVDLLDGEGACRA